VVIRNHTHHAVTYETLWPGDAGWQAVTLLPGQIEVHQRVGMAEPLEVLYETPTRHGPRAVLTVLAPFSPLDLPQVYNFRAGAGNKINLF
jgi:hypothetical protein